MTDDSGSRRRADERLETEPRYRSPLTISGRLRSIRHALAGLRFVLRSQHNAWLHALATAAAVGLAVAVSLSLLEWAVLAVVIALVWVAETFNTGLEVLADAVSPERHPTVKVAKDIAAGAVLLAALAAAVVGGILFVPRLVQWACEPAS